MIIDKNKLVWLSIIQGWAILLVVIGHVNTFTYGDSPTEMYQLGSWIHRFCYSFHMPLFMFVSGGLLYYSRVKSNWSTTALYRDKIKRLVIPYIAFTIIGFLVRIPFASFTKNSTDISFNGFENALFDPANGPLKELWFLGTLMWLMLMYPIYKVALKNVWTEIILLLMTLIPFIFSLDISLEGWFNISGVPNYALYFIAGMLFFKYDCIKYISHNWITVSGLVIIYLILFIMKDTPSWILALSGIAMSFALFARISHISPSLFSKFRDNSFQIFLIGIFPQMFVELIIWKHFHQAYLQIPYYLLSCLLALSVSILATQIVNKSSSNLLRRAFGLRDTDRSK